MDVYAIHTALREFAVVLVVCGNVAAWSGSALLWWLLRGGH